MAARSSSAADGISVRGTGGRDALSASSPFAGSPPPQRVQPTICGGGSPPELGRRQTFPSLRLAIAKALVSNVSSAIFCATMQSPAANPPSGTKHHAQTLLPAESSWSMLIIWPCRIRYLVPVSDPMTSNCFRKSYCRACSEESQDRSKARAFRSAGTDAARARSAVTTAIITQVTADSATQKSAEPRSSALKPRYEQRFLGRRGEALHHLAFAIL